MRIIIVGGSMAGLFAAGLLRQAGHEVIVLERSARDLDGRGAGLVAQPDVVSLLKTLGREDVVRMGVTARERITLDRSGAVLHRDAQPQTWIAWDHLYHALRGLLDEGVYRAGRQVVAVGESDGAPWVELEGGSWFAADLVIGADGVGSVVREMVVDRPGAGRVYAGHVVWSALVPERALPADATEALSDRFARYRAPDGQAEGYAVPGPGGEMERGGRRYACVWYRRTDDLAAIPTDADHPWRRYGSPPGDVPETARARLVEAARTLLPPPFAAVIAADPTPGVVGVFDLETPQRVKGRLALIGDAAFGARPYTDEGVAKAARDAVALAGAVARGWTTGARRAFRRSA